jgi:hypothetical protein
VTVLVVQYKRPTSEHWKAFPVYVESIIVRNIQLLALPTTSSKQPDIPQLRAEDSRKKIVLVFPRGGWYSVTIFKFTTARLCHGPGMLLPSRQRSGRVTNQHELRLAADESYLAASLKVPPPPKKIVRSEEASQRLIRDRQPEREGVTVTLRLRPRPASSRVRVRPFLAFFEI